MSDGTTGEGVLSKKWAKYLNCRLQGRVRGGGAGTFLWKMVDQREANAHIFLISRGDAVEKKLTVESKRAPMQSSF